MTGNNFLPRFMPSLTVNLLPRHVDCCVGRHSTPFSQPASGATAVKLCRMIDGSKSSLVIIVEGSCSSRAPAINLMVALIVSSSSRPIPVQNLPMLSSPPARLATWPIYAGLVWSGAPVCQQKCHRLMQPTIIYPHIGKTTSISI